MADQPTTSGSPDEQPTPESAETPASQTPASEAAATTEAPAPTAQSHGVAETTPPSDRRAWLRARAPLAAAAAALVLISGLGGFAIGHATGGDDGRDGFRPADFSGPQGPDVGQRPPSFRDGERGQGPNQGSDGSST